MGDRENKTAENKGARKVEAQKKAKEVSEDYEDYKEKTVSEPVAKLLASSGARLNCHIRASSRLQDWGVLLPAHALNRRVLKVWHPGFS
jgi:hypothetical protein